MLPTATVTTSRYQAMVFVHWHVAECAPHPLELPAVRIKDSDAVIAVTVGHEQLVGLRVDPFIRGPVQVLSVGVALALIAMADLHD